jgi:hypothetical protein
MFLSTVLDGAASHRTGGARSFPVSSDQSVWTNFAYDAPDALYAKLWFRHVDGHRGLPSSAAATPAAGWILPEEEDCHPVFVAHSVLAAIWLLRKMLPVALPDSGWQQLVGAAQSLSYHSATSSPPPSTQRPAAVQEEDSDSDADADAAAEPGSDSADPDPVPSQKRKGRTTSLSSAPKRVCTPARTVSPALSVETPSSDAPGPVVTVTNNNRRSDARIQKKISLAQEKRKLDVGLLPPAKNASAAEKLAYANVTPLDVQHISWLLKQPAGLDTDFYHNATSPYKTASDMLSKARAVGHQDAWSNAGSFIRSWRRHGTPFYSQEPAAPSPKALPAHATLLPADNAIFQYAWHMCDYYEGQLASAIIKYRWAMALLGRAHANRIAQLKDDDRAASSDHSRNRYGKGQIRTEAVNSLLRTVSSETPSKKQRLAFRQRLSRASRWYTAAMTLGWGSLCLMPPDLISNKWVEKTLARPEWDAWLQLVKKIEPDVHTASTALDAWLGADGIEGGSLKDKETLCIEEGPAAVAGEVEEVADSDRESESGVDSDGEEATTGTPCQPLRQLTLLELFVPRE